MQQNKNSLDSKSQKINYCVYARLAHVNEIKHITQMKIFN